MRDPLRESVTRLQEQLHALQVQFATQLIDQALLTLGMYLLLLVGTILTARLLCALGRAVLRRL